MTEKEAKEKWCPFMRIETRSGAAVNTRLIPTSHGGAFGMISYVETEITGKCIASSCMAWRQANEYESSGFCGLAGKPCGKDSEC